eukprot:1858443-Pleurochrysis_carterae.AAC.7
MSPYPTDMPQCISRNSSPFMHNCRHDFDGAIGMFGALHHSYMGAVKERRVRPLVIALLPTVSTAIKYQRKPPGLSLSTEMDEDEAKLGHEIILNMENPQSSTTTTSLVATTAKTFDTSQAILGRPEYTCRPNEAGWKHSHQSPHLPSIHIPAEILNNARITSHY